MTYLLLGPDTLLKDNKINELKQKILGSEEALRFDYEVLHAHKLAPEDLKKAMISLPAVASRRLVLIRECHRLNAQNKKLISEFVKSKDKQVAVILDAGDMESRDSFVRSLGSDVQLVDTGKGGRKLTAFDLTRAVSVHKTGDALKILSQLLEEGAAPLQIMGAMVWSWSEMRPRLSSANFEKGLRVLQDADLNIKRSRLNPEQALEVAVVELCSLER